MPKHATAQMEPEENHPDTEREQPKTITVDFPTFLATITLDLRDDYPGKKSIELLNVCVGRELTEKGLPPETIVDQFFTASRIFREDVLDNPPPQTGINEDFLNSYLSFRTQQMRADWANLKAKELNFTHVLVAWDGADISCTPVRGKQIRHDEKPPLTIMPKGVGG